MCVCVSVWLCVCEFFVYKRLLNRYVSNDDIFSECSVTFRQPNEDGILGITQQFACYGGWKKVRPLYSKPKMMKCVYWALYFEKQTRLYDVTNQGN